MISKFRNSNRERMIPGIFSSTSLLSFNVPLLTSLNPTNVSLAPTYTRSTTAIVKDFEGLFKTAKIGEARFAGARRVENIFTFTENFNNSRWSTFTSGGGAVAISPDGKSITFSAPAGGRAFLNLTESITAGRTYVVTGTVSNVTGDGYTIYQSGVISSVGRVTNKAIASSQNIRIGVGTGGVVTNASTMTFTLPMLENVTGQSNQNPSEYVSVGVLSYPYHGASVDGVKYFTTQNGNTVSSNIVTEATGAAISETTMLGYITEFTRTQLTLHNQVIQDAYWDKAAGLVSALDNQKIAPDGTTTACLLSELAGTGSHHLHEVTGPFTPTVGQPYCMQVFVKRPATAADRYIQLAFWSGGFGVDAYLNFDLLNKTIGTIGSSIVGYGTSTVACGIEELTGVNAGWLMIWATALCTSATASGFQMAFVSSDTAPRAESYTVTAGNEESIYIWRPNVELGYTPSLPLETVASTVTRNADILTFPNSGVVSDVAGTIYMEATPNFNIPNSNTNAYGLNVLSDFGSSNGLFWTQANNLRFRDGTNSPTTPAWTPLRNVTYKVAAKYGSGGLKNFLNGTAGTGTAFDGSINSGANMQIGGTPAYSAAWGGYIKNVKIWKKPLSDGKIISLTS